MIWIIIYKRKGQILIKNDAGLAEPWSMRSGYRSSKWREKPSFYVYYEVAKYSNEGSAYDCDIDTLGYDLWRRCQRQTRAQ